MPLPSYFRRQGRLLWRYMPALQLAADRLQCPGTRMWRQAACRRQSGGTTWPAAGSLPLLLPTVVRQAAGGRRGCNPVTLASLNGATNRQISSRVMTAAAAALRPSAAPASAEAAPAPPAPLPGVVNNHGQGKRQDQELFLDWKVGAALAGAAFEAYNELKERGLPERHACGAEVFYLDREFVQERLAGLLQVNLRRASSPPAAAACSHPLSSAPELQLCLGDSVWSSGTVLNNINPDWKENCTFYVRDPASQPLRVQVVGADSDDAGSLGYAVQELGPLCDGQAHHLDLQLLCSSSGGSGSGSGSGDNSGMEGEHCSRAHTGATPGGSDVGSSGSSGGGGRGGDKEIAGSNGSNGGGGSAISERLEPCGSVQLSCRFYSLQDALAKNAAAHSEMGGPVVGTPGQIPLAEDWRELLELAGVAAHSTFKPMAYIENITTSTEVWVYWNKEQRTACVSFRGTEQGKWRDILTDLSLVPAPLDPDRVAAAPRHAALSEVSQPPEEPGQLSQILSTVEQAKQEVAAERQQQADGQSSQEQAQQHILATAVSTVRSTAEDLKAVLDRVRGVIEAAEERRAAEEEGKEEQPWVHGGFLTAYDSVRPAVLSLLATLLGGQHGGVEREEGPPWMLYLTGHSLGGALATLCAWDCAHRSWPAPLALEVWNFGCPRVGNRAFAEHFNSLVPRTFRVVNAADSVCTVPRLMGYAHVGHAIYLQSDGSVDVVMNSTQQWGEGLSLATDVAPVVGSAVQASVVAKVPELLPQVAAEALRRVGFEVAAAGSGDAEEAQAEAEAEAEAQKEAEALAGAEAGGDDPSAEAGVSGSLAPQQLPDLWEEERRAWGMLLDGAGLDQHMEPLYLASLKAVLAAAAQEGEEGQRPG